MEWAVIFDWDGVILDSSQAHERSWELIAEEKSLPLPKDHFERSFGRKSDAIISEILKWSHDPFEIRSLTDRKEVLYREIVMREGIQALPGVEPWLRALQDHQVPCAVGSSTPHENIRCLSALLGVEGFFTTIVAAEDVTRGKPDPDVFLQAAARLGVNAEHCVVFEDAPAGIEAALAAGMLAVGVAGTHGVDGLSRAHTVVQRMDELTPQQVKGWLKERTAANG